MTTRSTLGLTLAALVALSALTGCATGDPAPEETELYVGIGEGDTGDVSDGASDGGGSATYADLDPITVGGMPLDGIMLACDTVVDYKVTSSDFDVQWRWEFECRSREPFDRTVAGLGSVAWLTQTQAQILGTDAYVTDKYHWIGEQGNVVDVDLTLKGRDGDFEMVYLVTKRTD